jgi:adenylate cyclase
LLAAAQAGNGAADAAANHAAQVLKLSPDFTVTAHFATLHHRHEADQDHHREMLLRAGLPE